MPLRLEHVIVLERDSFPAQLTHWAGTPQARHVHGLLLSGRRALSDALRSRPAQAGLDVRRERPGYDPFSPRDLCWSGYAALRPAIERALRRRVEGRANITVRQRCRGSEVLASPDGAMATCVRWENDRSDVCFGSWSCKDGA